MAEWSGAGAGGYGFDWFRPGTQENNVVMGGPPELSFSDEDLAGDYEDYFGGGDYDYQNYDPLGVGGGRVYRDETETYRGQGEPVAGGGAYREPPRQTFSTDPYANWNVRGYTGGGGSWNSYGVPEGSPIGRGSTFRAGGGGGTAGSGGGVAAGGGTATAGVPLPDLGKPGDAIWNRLQNVLGDPSQIAQDPAYQFLYNQGMQAFNRTAAARKMAQAGKTGLDAMNYGQGLALNRFKDVVGMLQPAAQQELQRWSVPSQLALQRHRGGQGDVRNLLDIAGFNNRVMTQQSAERAAQDLAPLYSDAWNRMMQGGTPSAMGGLSSSDIAPRLGPSYGGLGYQAPQTGYSSLAPRLEAALMNSDLAGDYTDYFGGDLAGEEWF